MVKRHQHEDSKQLTSSQRSWSVIPSMSNFTTTDSGGGAGVRAGVGAGMGGGVGEGVSRPPRNVEATQTLNSACGSSVASSTPKAMSTIVADSETVFLRSKATNAGVVWICTSKITVPSLPRRTQKSISKPGIVDGSGSAT